MYCVIRRFLERVREQRGTPNLCSACERTDKNTRYEWANLTGEFKNIFDYIRLCNPCHQRFDKRFCKRGHSLDESNSNVQLSKTKTGKIRRVCRTCRQLRKKYKYVKDIPC